MSQQEFLALIRDNQGIIYKLVSLYADDEEEKKDLYQEILLQAWKGWPRFRGESKFSTWLYRISINTILTQNRKKKGRKDNKPLEEVHAHVLNGGLAREDLRRLQTAIRKLSETDRIIVSLHLDGYDNHEIGSIVGISHNNVAVKLHRSKQQLSNLLTQ